MTLSIIRGLPGSGKSTFARDHFPGVFHVENDMFHVTDGKYMFDQKKCQRVFGTVLSMVEMTLRLGADVTVSNVFMKLSSISRFVVLAREIGANVEIYQMAGQNFGDVHWVPSNVKASMERGFADIPANSDFDWPKVKYIYPLNFGSYEILEEKK